MNIVLFSHPNFLGHQSMPRFAKMIEAGMKQRGHEVEVWRPESFFFNIKVPVSLRKWLAYIDQYLVFPRIVKQKLKKCPSETLFVFADQALGPWVPMVKDRPHVIHCHDFLAQYSAEGKIAENRTGWTGKQYQLFIRNGYKNGKNFISVSEKTRQDLHYFLTAVPDISEVVYNGVNPLFKKEEAAESRLKIETITGIDVKNGYLLHVGGNQWYKNRKGVLEIYDAWRSLSKLNLPLLMIGEKPDTSLMAIYQKSPFKGDIHFLSDIKDVDVKFAYAGACLFLFPSLAEGFGWPIAEAMACGCPVITTNEAPMSEVAGNAGFLIPRRPCESAESWAIETAAAVDKVITSLKETSDVVNNNCLLNASRFNQDKAMDKIEEIYLRITQNFVK